MLNDKWETAEYDARHIQRDLSDDLAEELASFTGLSALRAELETIRAREKTKRNQEDCQYLMHEAELYHGGQHGEHTKD